MMPVYQHPEDDLESFRFFTSQIIVNGNATLAEIVKAFGVRAITIKRWVKKYLSKLSENQNK